MMQGRNLLGLVSVAALIIVCATSIGAGGDSTNSEDQCNLQDQECGKTESSTVGRIARLKSDGMDGQVQMTDLLHFPNYKQPGEGINIAERIAGSINCNEFGIHLLEDHDGSQMNIIEKNNPQNAFGVMKATLERWIQGKSGLDPITWKTFIKCLHDKNLNSLAEDIENFFATPNSKPLNSGSYIWRNDKKIEHVNQLLQKVQLSTEAIKASSIGASQSIMGIISEDLDRLLTRLRNGTVRVGIVGLTKAGKSTFLNALLGKNFLPSSVQPQTANEVVMIHDMSTPQGELYCVVKERATLLASGQNKIFHTLLDLNNKRREKDRPTMVHHCDKLVLHSPFQFLAKSDIQDLQLELSDTPGFGEAGAKSITEDINITVKELCAFVLIMNSQNMKTVSELKLLNDLMHYHPQLFSKLNRVLILVNARSDIYSQGKLNMGATLAPEDVPHYVSEYIKQPEFLNIEVSPERILLFNALWALRTRQWKDTNERSRVLKQDTNEGKILYDEAMLMLRYINRGDDANNLEDDMDDENIDAAISILEPFSQIQNVENRLREMVVENAGLVLLESAVDDTVSVIRHSLLPAIKELIQNEDIEAKEAEVRSLMELNSIFRGMLSLEVFDSFESLLKSSTLVHVSTLRDTVQESLSNVISSKLMDSLRDVIQLEKKEDVLKEMQRARSAIPDACLAKMKHDWLTISSTIRSAASEQMNMIFSDIRATFLSSINKISAKEPDLRCLLETLATNVPLMLATAGDNTASLVPDTSSLAVDKLTFSTVQNLQDATLSAYMQEGKKQKFRTTDRKKCGGGFLGWGRSCVHFTEAIPYDQTVYSPNLKAFRSAFDDVIKYWMGLYNEQVERHLQSIAVSTSAVGKEKLAETLKDYHQRVTEMLELRQNSLEKCKDDVVFLNQKLNELSTLKNELRKSI